MDAVRVERLGKQFKTRIRAGGPGQALLSVLRPQYQSMTAVRDISFSVSPGEALAFIGPNGAGKSTTIKMLTGILYPTSGAASVLGRVPWRDRQQLAFEIGAVFGQKSQLWYHLPSSDTFSLLKRIYEIPEAEFAQRQKRLVELFDIGDLMNTPVRKLSLGQRMRCEIAASLLHGPKVLFLDEPTIGLDVVAKQRIRDLIHALNKEDGVTVFLTSHDLGDVERLCKRAIIINHGQIIYDGSLRALQQQYQHTKVIDLRLADALVDFSLPGARVAKAKDYGVKVLVDTREGRVAEVLARILANNTVVDVNISDTPLEQIIAQIYEGQSVQHEVLRDGISSGGISPGGVSSSGISSDGISSDDISADGAGQTEAVRK